MKDSQIPCGMVIGDLRGQGAKEERKRVGLKCRTEEDKK
jgi:hypothetical protein